MDALKRILNSLKCHILIFLQEKYYLFSVEHCLFWLIIWLILGSQIPFMVSRCHDFLKHHGQLCCSWSLGEGLGLGLGFSFLRPQNALLLLHIFGSCLTPLSLPFSPKKKDSQGIYLLLVSSSYFSFVCLFLFLIGEKDLFQRPQA